MRTRDKLVLLRQSANQEPASQSYPPLPVAGSGHIGWAIRCQEMGRKAAPQPLSLGQSKNLGQESASAETHPTSTPSGSKSPISPRSPFRFGQKKPGISGGAKLTPQSPDVSPQERQQQRWQHHPQQQQQQQSEQQQDQLNDAAQYPPRSAPIQPSPVRSSSPANQAPTRLQQPQSQFQQSHGHGHGHHRQDEGKKSKSGFFHFNKATRSSDRINLHQHTESRAEAMSRDADFAPVSKQNTKYSGMKEKRDSREQRDHRGRAPAIETTC